MPVRFSFVCLLLSLGCSDTSDAGANGNGRSRNGSGGIPAASGGASGGLGATTSGATASGGVPASGGMTATGGNDGGPAPSNPVPTIPVGLDAYLNWERLPTLRLGTRTYMRSTYDRSGGNEGADASHFLRQETPTRNVALDVAGPGVLEFVRTNHWHGSPWHYGVDAVDHAVSESSTADPNNPVSGSVFLPETAFPSPLAWTWSVTKGADLNWVPVTFAKSLTLSFERTHYGTGYFIYQAFPERASNLSHELTPFTSAAPDPRVLDLLRRAGDDIAPAGAAVTTASGTVDVGAGAAVILTTLTGARTIRALQISAPKASAVDLGNARLRITWDGRAAPSVDAPLALFFGAGSFYNRDDKEWLVKALLQTVRFESDTVKLATYLPMPFFRDARIELVGGTANLQNLSWSIRSETFTGSSNDVGYFHATYRDHGQPTAGKDLVLLDTAATEGGGDFCGSFVGTSFTFSDHAVLTTLEGDPRFFFDDSDSPQGYGTGTEEWAGGGDYWGGVTMTLPLAGHPVGAPNVLVAKSDEDQVQGAYRLLLADAMPFGKNARIQLEHGALNDSTEHYRTVTYWYGLPGACLVRTDALDVGSTSDEAAHRYASPDASAPETVTSRHELGVDHVGLTEVYPATTEDGRHTTGTTEFTAKLAPENVGALLRRKLDYAYPNQRAEVFVADDRDGAPFVLAGTWYLAGSNRCVYSNPPGELDPATVTAETSNRRFRDDEFLVPRDLTEGRAAVRFRFVFSPVDETLYPSAPMEDRAWSELRYSVYSWVRPPEP